MVDDRDRPGGNKRKRGGTHPARYAHRAAATSHTLGNLSSGVLVTSDVHTAGKAVLDCYRVLNAAAGELYGAEEWEKVGDELRAAREADGSGKDVHISETLDAELAALGADDGTGEDKEKRPKIERRLASVPTKVGGMIAIRINDPEIDPVRLVDAVFERQAASERTISQYIHKMRPVSGTCPALPITDSTSALIAALKPIFDAMETKLGVVDAPEADPKLTPEEAKAADTRLTFAIDLRVRNNDRFKEQKVEVLKMIASGVANPRRWRVDLSSPTVGLTVLVDVIGTLCMYAAVERYRERKKLNLAGVRPQASAEETNDNAAEAKVEGDGKKEEEKATPEAKE